jgi:small conductance mechanosensitive channel
MEFWRRLIIVAVVVIGAAIVAKLVDWRMSRRELPPEAVTRYKVLRSSLMTAIIAVGILSAALVIPQVRAIAAGILASSALVGLVVGLAAQRPLANFVAGIVIAFTQPLRLGDRVTIDDVEGTVEEIGLTYTFIRTSDNARLVIPNEKLASDTIRNSTIRSRETFAEITVPVPLSADLGAAVDGLREEIAEERDASVYVSSLDGNATLTIRAAAPNEDAAQKLERDLRMRAHGRLRALGIWG